VQYGIIYSNNYRCDIWRGNLEIVQYNRNMLNPIKIFIFRASWSWSYGSWMCNYLCNQCLSPLLALWVRIPHMERCIRYSILWYSLPVTCDRSVDLHPYYFTPFKDQICFYSFWNLALCQILPCTLPLPLPTPLCFGFHCLWYNIT
jgi:hypothetical protein